MSGLLDFLLRNGVALAATLLSMTSLGASSALAEGYFSQLGILGSLVLALGAVVAFRNRRKAYQG